MTVAQLQNLRSFAQLHLTDVVDWSRDVRVDEKATTGDQAYVTIKTPYNSYRMSVLSSYIQPPAGAPVMCKSLGTVTFDDVAGEKHVVGPKADNTYTEISQHIHKREISDALAVCRRDLAEAPKERVAIVRAKMAGLVDQAKKWGVKVTQADLIAAAAPELLEVTPPMQIIADTLTAASEIYPDAAPRTFIAGFGPVVQSEPEDPANHEYAKKLDTLMTFVGMPIVFITNPGEQINGMQEIPGTIVALNGDLAAVFVTPANSEPRYYDKLPRRGGQHRFNCWDVAPWFEALMVRLLKLEHPEVNTYVPPSPDAPPLINVGTLAENIDMLQGVVSELTGRLKKLENPPKPKLGRPRKAAEHAPDTGE